MGRSDPDVEGCASGARLLGTDAAPASEAAAPLHDHWAIAITALRRSVLIRSRHASPPGGSRLRVLRASSARREGDAYRHPLELSNQATHVRIGNRAPSRFALLGSRVRSCEIKNVELVSLTFAIWSQIGDWITRVEALRYAAWLAWTTLVGFKHHVWIQPRRPPRRQPARPDRHQSYRHNHGRQRCGIRRLDAEQH